MCRLRDHAVAVQPVDGACKTGDGGSDGAGPGHRARPDHDDRRIEAAAGAWLRRSQRRTARPAVADLPPDPFRRGIAAQDRAAGTGGASRDGRGSHQGRSRTVHCHDAGDRQGAGRTARCDTIARLSAPDRDELRLDNGHGAARKAARRRSAVSGRGAVAANTKHAPHSGVLRRFVRNRRIWLLISGEDRRRSGRAAPGPATSGMSLAHISNNSRAEAAAKLIRGGDTDVAARGVSNATSAAAGSADHGSGQWRSFDLVRRA